MTPFAPTPRTSAEESKRGLTQGAIAFVLGASLGAAGFLVLMPARRICQVAGVMRVPIRTLPPLPTPPPPTAALPPLAGSDTTDPVAENR